jgi:hypothetical protein
MSQFSGYVSTPLYDLGYALYEHGDQFNLSTLIVPPENHSTMISILQYQPYFSTVRIIHNPGKDEEVTEIPRARHFKELFYATSFTVLYIMLPKLNARIGGFKLAFTFHPSDNLPQKLESGYYNCSVDYYASFRRHFECTSQQECGEDSDVSDENNCLACSSQSQDRGDCAFCSGGVGAPHNGKCYLTVPVTTQYSDMESFLTTASTTCEERGFKMAVVKSLRDVISVPQYDTTRCQASLHISLDDRYFDGYTMGVFYGGLSVPNIYRQVWTGYDKSVLYNPYMQVSQRRPVLFVLFQNNPG